MKSKQEYLLELIKIADNKGGKCLSHEYIDNKTKLKFVCLKSHEFDAIPNNIKSGKWCKICAIAFNSDKRRKGIEEMHILAKAMNGECLSDKYVNSHTKLTWKCNVCNEIWEARPANVKTGYWCPKCARDRINKAIKKRKLNIEELQEIAKGKGGKCLATQYINSGEPILWECKEGHQWLATVSSIKNTKSKKGSWCPRCAGTLITMEEIKKLASKYDGECISKEYLGCEMELKWKCNKGHIWSATPSKIKSGYWCKECYKESLKKYSIEDLQAKAKLCGGEVISKKYEGALVKLKWKCAEGHEFYKTPTKVMTCDEWCSKCTIYINEERCRYIFETLFSRHFHKNRTVLDGLELDGYNEELSLAFEYHGKQHYERVKFFDKEEESFNKRVENDKETQNRCNNKGIVLIIIPYYVIGKKSDEMLNYIVNKLQEKNIKYEYDIKNFSYKKFWNSISKLNEAKDIAKGKNGKCLSDVYFNSDTYLNWQCNKCGSIWSDTLRSVRRGDWCRACKKEVRMAENKIKRFNKIKKLALKNEGECLSTEYVNDNNKMKFKCHEGHVWKTTPASIFAGSWCVVCSKKNKYSYDEINEIVRSKNHICLTDKTIKRDTNVGIKCENRHEFFIKASKIRKGYECPICKILKSKKLDNDFDYISQTRGIEIIYYNCIGNVCNLKYKCRSCSKEYNKTLGELLNKKEACEACKLKRLESKSNIEKKNSNMNNKVIIKKTFNKENKFIENFQYASYIASEKNGKCLTELIKTKSELIKWECNDGHTFELSLTNALNGRWCKICFFYEKANEKFKELKELARRKNGVCLSNKYENNEKKLRWRCNVCSTEWEANARHICKDNSWCPTCAIENNARKLRGNIEEMKEIAKKRNGKCLSQKYVNARTSLLWECSEGHTWLATPDYVKNRKRWCRECKKIEVLELKKS